MRHLGTLIPRFCTEFRYLSYGQSGLACGAIFEKVPKYEEMPSFSKYACPFFQEQVPKMSFSPMSHRQLPKQRGARGAEPLENAGGVRGGRPQPPPQDALLMLIVTQSFQTHGSSELLVLQSFQKSRLYQSGWSFSISRKAGYIKMVGPSVFPEREVISECLVLQYFQIHKSKNQVLKPNINFLGKISSPK